MARSPKTRAASRGVVPPPAARDAHHASTCRWASPTISMPAPYWWDAEGRPWTCVRSATPRLLETTQDCVVCGQWAPRRRDRSSGE